MNKLEDIGIIPLDFAAISNIIGEYKAPKDKISKMVKAGRLIRLKKGLFVVSPEITKMEISKELIANHLLGPSYISMESALSYYSLIPERVYISRSATVKRSKIFYTPLGTFEYLTIPDTYYSIGIKNLITSDSYAFLMASPEKALCDLILCTSKLRLQSRKAMISYLNEDLRIDFTSTPFHDFGIIERCIEVGKKKRELRLLYEILKKD